MSFWSNVLCVVNMTGSYQWVLSTVCIVMLSSTSVFSSLLLAVEMIMNFSYH